jgi:ABC-type arginine transport system ATPase subunit
MAAAIIVERMGKRFGSVQALDEIDLEVTTGGVLGLLGPPASLAWIGGLLLVAIPMAINRYRTPPDPDQLRGKT